MNIASRCKLFAMLLTTTLIGVLSACTDKSIVSPNGEVYEFPSGNCPEGEIYAGVQPHIRCWTPLQYEILFGVRS